MAELVLCAGSLSLSAMGVSFFLLFVKVDSKLARVEIFPLGLLSEVSGSVHLIFVNYAMDRNGCKIRVSNLDERMLMVKCLFANLAEVKVLTHCTFVSEANDRLHAAAITRDLFVFCYHVLRCHFESLVVLLSLKKIFKDFWTLSLEFPLHEFLNILLVLSLDMFLALTAFSLFHTVCLLAHSILMPLFLGMMFMVLVVVLLVMLVEMFFVSMSFVLSSELLTRSNFLF